MRLKVLLISATHFRNIPALTPLKGEDRQRYFWRLFAGKFSKREEAIINEFFERFGRSPMLPKWKNDPCYMQCAIEFFWQHPAVARICSALYLGDLTAAFPTERDNILLKVQKIYIRNSLSGNPDQFLRDQTSMFEFLKRSEHENKKRNRRRTSQKGTKTQPKTSKR